MTRYGQQPGPANGCAGVAARKSAAALLVLEALAAALKLEIAMRLLPAGRVVQPFLQAAGPMAGYTARQNERSAHAARIVRAVDRAYRLLPVEASCLKRALVVCRLHRRRGHDVCLRLGVAKPEGRFSAHAWVEDGEGRALTDPLEQFSPFPPPTRPAPASD